MIMKSNIRDIKNIKVKVENNKSFCGDKYKDLTPVEIEIYENYVKVENKHILRVINIECPYRGRHKYELNKDELREYEKIKKRLQRAKLLDNNKIILYLVDSFIKEQTYEATGFLENVKYYIYKDKNNKYRTEINFEKGEKIPKRISCIKYFDENTNEGEIDGGEPL